MKLEIQTGNSNPILRAISKEVKPDEIRSLLELGREMTRWLKAKDNGAGLAAPQVGVNKRLIAVNFYDESGDEIEYIRTILMFNPKIHSHSNETQIDEEGCFSVPDVYRGVRRWTSITVEFLDESGKARIMRLSGFNARVVQHEVDHLDGILFTDKTESALKAKTHHEAF